ncbi:MAG TPA: helix-turn-helix domain-containing protein [Polyangia bacterium]
MSTERDTRAAILDAARRLLEERGYYGIGLDAIGRAAGVSRQAVYLHFRSKAGLLLALVEHVDQQHDLDASRAPIAAARDAPAMLDALVAHMVSYTPRIHRIATVLDSARRTDSAAEAAWQNRMASRRAGQRRIVARLAEEGRLAEGWSIDAATDFVWALTSIRVWEDLVLARGWPKRRYVQHLRRVLRASLVARRAHRR